MRLVFNSTLFLKLLDLQLHFRKLVTKSFFLFFVELSVAPLSRVSTLQQNEEKQCEERRYRERDPEPDRNVSSVQGSGLYRRCKASVRGFKARNLSAKSLYPVALRLNCEPLDLYCPAESLKILNRDKRQVAKQGLCAVYSNVEKRKRHFDLSSRRKILEASSDDLWIE